MSTREWSPQYVIGIPPIDAQHRALFRSLDTLARAIDEGDDDGVLGAMTGDIARATHDHFVSEEQFHERAGVDDLEGHRQEHRAIEAIVARVLDEHARGRRVDWRWVLGVLERRLSDHLLTRDMKLRAGAAAPAGCGGRVMIIDDSPTVVLHTKKRLEGLGFSVSTRTTALGSTVAVMAERPGFVLLDVEMPGIDGDGLCRQIRARTGVPVVFHSAVPREKLHVIGREAGALGVVCKTRDEAAFARELVTACSRLCGGKGCAVSGVSKLLDPR